MLAQDERKGRKLDLAIWWMHRALLDHAGVRSPFSAQPYKRALFLSVNDEISQAQVFPFFQHKDELRNSLGLEIRELPLSEFLATSPHYRDHLDIVFLQTWFEINPSMRSIVEKIKGCWPCAKLVYLDWFAPTDLRFAETLTGEVTVYVKKQVLADFSEYGQPTWGHTNLTNYYSRRFGIDTPEVTFPVPPSFRELLILGHGFERSPRIAKYTSSGVSFVDRQIDLHARIATAGTPWYASMRNEAKQAMLDLPSSLNVARAGYVSRREFMRELRNSKLCFSPFGYGEICWRDFEAMAAGAMLLKPNVSHLLMAGNYFEPYETYVPVSWDLSDLKEKVDYYLCHHSERTRIAKNALIRLKQDRSFIRQLAPLWRQLGLAPQEPYRDDFLPAPL